MSITPEYSTWKHIKQRCYNPKDKDYHYYGGRGIKVCERWRDSFSNFLEDMGKRPEGMTLDRKDNDGNYTLKNCRWTTKSEQCLNRGIFKNKTSQYRGVHWKKQNNKWQASVQSLKTYCFLGYYVTEEEAAYVRDQVALQIYGKNYKLNFEL